MAKRTDTTRKTTHADTIDKRYPTVTAQDTFPLETALRNVGYKLIDNIRYNPGNIDDYIAGKTDVLIRGRHEKRGTVWMPLHKCPRQPEFWYGKEVIWRNGIKMTCPSMGKPEIIKNVGIF